MAKLALVASAALWWLLRPFRVAVEGRSMAPALQPGDFLVAVKAKRPRPGSVVVLEHPGRPGFELVKRVEGRRGGDGARAEVYWLAGDSPDASTDSRSFGPVPRSAIKGVVVARYWPPTRAAWLHPRRVRGQGSEAGPALGPVSSTSSGDVSRPIR